MNDKHANHNEALMSSWSKHFGRPPIQHAVHLRPLLRISPFLALSEDAMQMDELECEDESVLSLSIECQDAQEAYDKYTRNVLEFMRLN